jgi:hypothetical protein
LVTNWLNENVSGATGDVVIDKTLTIEGAVAESKATGEKITEQTNNLTQFKNSFDYIKSKNLYNPSELEEGLVGEDGSSNKVEGYSITGLIPFTYGQTMYFSRYTVPVSIYQYAFYDNNKNLISRTSHYETSVTAPENCAYLRIGMITSNFENGFQIEYNEITDYQEYFEPYPITKHNYITVSKNGKCDYNTNFPRII